MEGIRTPAVAGLFYPEPADELANVIDTLLEKNSLDFSPEKIYGLIVPHAGYVYSGQTAAYAYNLLRNKSYKTVVVLAPSHREYFQGISLFAGNGYNTPLGTVPIDVTLSEQIIQNSKDVFGGLIGHGDHEHSLEVQIPFLQKVLKDFKLVPMVIGDQSRNYIDSLAEVLSEVYNDEILIVASSDLSHFHKKEEAKILDGVIVDYINNLDHENLLADLEKNKCEACGGGPIVSLIKAASKNNFNKAKVLHVSDSGDVTGDNTGVVGYLSAVIYE